MSIGRVNRLLVNIGMRAYRRPTTRKLFNAAAELVGVIGKRIPGYAYGLVRAEIGYDTWKNEHLMFKKDAALLGQNWPGYLHAGFWGHKGTNGRLGSTTPMGMANVDQNLFYRLIQKVRKAL